MATAEQRRDTGPEGRSTSGLAPRIASAWGEVAAAAYLADVTSSQHRRREGSPPARLPASGMTGGPMDTHPGVKHAVEHVVNGGREAVVLCRSHRQAVELWRSGVEYARTFTLPYAERWNVSADSLRILRGFTGGRVLFVPTSRVETVIRGLRPSLGVSFAAPSNADDELTALCAHRGASYVAYGWGS